MLVFVCLLYLIMYLIYYLFGYVKALVVHEIFLAFCGVIFFFFFAGNFLVVAHGVFSCGM